MPAPLQHVVEAILTPYNDRIRRAIDRGFRGFVRKIGGNANYLKRTDAVDVFDSVARELIAEFKTESDVKVFEGAGTVRLLFGGRVLARFKKAGRNGRGMNLRTRANDRFLDPRLPFAEAPEAAKVEICWAVNATGTSFETLHVTARNGEGALWSYAMPGGAQQVLPFPKRDAPAEESPRRSVVKLKGRKPEDKTGDAS
ncbi:MAG: hypothetical protein ABSC22_15855 [Roseiarcus sp.]|jgi:hypothetical protein